MCMLSYIDGWMDGPASLLIKREILLEEFDKGIFLFPGKGQQLTINSQPFSFVKRFIQYGKEDC